MPLVSSLYVPPFPFQNGRLNTVFPTLFRRVDYPDRQEGGDSLLRRERISTPDGDFLDIDIYPSPASPRFLAVLTHGLGGNSRRKYVRGMARAFRRAGGLCAAWNHRGASGEINRARRFSHMGETGDLTAVAAWAERFDLPIVLAGFSMGAHQTLSYLGGDNVSPAVVCGIAISDPCDTVTAGNLIDTPRNTVFRRYLLKQLLPLVREKLSRYPDIAGGADVGGITDFHTFDNLVTAPAFGFRSAEDYYSRVSVLPRIPFIRKPVFLLNALDDPFCTPACHPFSEAEKNPVFWFEASRWGGHMGFVTKGDTCYHEERAVRFLNERSGF